MKQITRLHHTSPGSLGVALVLMSAAALAVVEVAQPAETETAIFSGGDMALERDARLLVCGAWPDKNLTITPEDLDGIVSRFSADTIPVKTEHTDSPLDPLGLVKSIWREGNALMGRLAFPADLHSFLQRRGVNKLSVGLERSPVALAEVSLVLKPRVASAAMLSEDAPSGDAPTGGGGSGNAPKETPPALRAPSPLRERTGEARTGEDAEGVALAARDLTELA
ncbi:MAG: hypothetical protein M3Y28_11100, partial [Armatimonadota bacterium]|nr:hypothetical protein [Armatimonadota bacterium]